MAQRRNAVATACAVALLAAGCGSGGGTTPPQSISAVYQRLVAGFVAYASCARAHGMPNLPDPQVDDQGNEHYPSLGTGAWRWPQSVLTGCARVWDRVHAIRDEFDNLHRPSPSPVDYRQAVKFARCVRLHGFPTFPDPDSSGRFAVTPPGFSKLHLSPQASAAIDACRTK